MRDIFTGTDPKGNKVFLPLEQFAKTHTHILGRSGTGKTKLLERIARDVIKAGYGLIIIDGKGQMYDNILNHCCFMSIPPKRITLIDPTQKYAPGLNILETDEDTYPDTQAGLVIDAIKKVHGQEKEAQPWLERWGRAIFTALSAGKLTLADVMDFARVDDPEFRNAVLAKIDNRSISGRWEEFENTFKIHKRAEVLDSIKNRCEIFQMSPYLKGMFGQEKTTINWEKVVYQGNIMLARLEPGNIDQKVLSYIGIFLLHQINQMARKINKQVIEQGRPKPPPCFIIMDEFQEFISPDISRVLDQLRNYNLFFFLSHHNLAQLEQNDPLVYHSVMSNCRNKIMFTISHPDAEIMINEVFSKELYQGMQETKHEEWRTVVIPEKDYETIETTSERTSAGTSLSYPEDNSFWLASPDVASKMIGEMESQDKAVSYATVPTINHTVFKERSSTTFYSEAEARIKYINELLNQPNRTFYIKLEHTPAIPLYSSFVTDRAIWYNNLKSYREKIFKETARHINEVQKEIDERVPLYLSSLEEKQQDDDKEYYEPDN